MSGAVLVPIPDPSTPTLSDYFGLTGPARPVFVIVLPALALWFVVVSLVLRFRVLDRVLGYDQLPGRG